MRGKPWSEDEEKQLRLLVGEGKSLDTISSIMGKTRVSVKGKLFNLGLSSVKVATSPQHSVAAATAAASSPAVSDNVPLSTSTPFPAIAASIDVVGIDLKMPERLPSVEEELKILAAAVEALRQPGLSRSEVSRLHNIIVGVKVYQELFAKYVDYCGLETEILELRRQLASKNAKSSNDTSP